MFLAIPRTPTLRVVQMSNSAQMEGFDPEEYPGEGSTGSKQNGNDAEAWVIDHYDLEPRDPEVCEESSHDAVDPRTGTPLEIKSCQVRYNGNGSRGRFQIWDYAHQNLLEAGGGYIFVVHEPKTEEFTVYFHRPLSAERVDELIGNWHPIDHTLRPDDAHRTSLGQSVVFSDIEVSRIEPDPVDQDPETDADSETPQMERISEIKAAINDIEEQQDQNDGAPHGAVVQRVVETTGTDPDTVEHHIEELRKKGEIYSPAKGHHRVT